MGGTNHTTETRAEIIAKGDQAVADIRGMDSDQLHALPFETRFDYINAIKNGLHARFPAPDDNPGQEILDTEETRNPIGVLRRLTNSINLSDGYENFVMKIITSATEDLAKSTAYVRQLLDWDTLTKTQRVSLSQTFHDTVIGHAQLALRQLKANDGVIHMAKPLKVVPFVEEPELLEDGHVLSFNGYAALHHDEWPGAAYVGLNTHPYSGFDSATETIETIAHESAHVIEGFLAFTFGHHAPFVPDQFVGDGKLLYHMYDKEAYIMSRLATAYRDQTNEVVARKAGETANTIITDAMARMAPS